MSVMAKTTNEYSNPLVDRYASRAMVQTFSADSRYRTWRRLWVALAEAQSELGLDIAPQQIEEMRQHIESIDYRRVAEVERETRHDVVAHIRAYGEQCPAAAPIIHLGATSCFVTDNSDLLLVRRALELVRDRLRALLAALRDFALRYRSLPALAYTHFQPAQLTTVGKRAALWAQDFLMDLEEVEERARRLRFRGVKGTTGTQASFLKLFEGNHDKVDELDRLVSEKMGFSERFQITGQTYSRKQDEFVLHALSSIAQSAHKASNDLRLLQGLGELEEPFEKSQVGSSAMPYKRNPMRLERISSLAKYAICEAQNAGWVHATQWFERTLDDSANRRLSIPQCFLAADALLILMVNVARGLVVYPELTRRRLDDELPFIASENLLMMAVRAGGDRQRLHERIRQHAMDVATARRAGSGCNNLLERLAEDPLFSSVRSRIAQVSDPAAYIGRSPEQVERFFRTEVDPVLEGYEPPGDEFWKIEV